MLAIPIVMYAVTVAIFAVNVPVGDDHVVLDTVTELHRADSWPTRLALLLAPHNEHRIVMSRLFAWLASQLPGGIDFRVLILLGNAALLGALLIVGRTLRFGRRWAAWAILALLVLQPQAHKMMFYPMAIIQGYVGLLFSLAYLHFTLMRDREHIAPVFLACATLSTGAGIFVAVLGVFVLVRRKRWAPLAVHVAISLPLSVWYLRDLPSPGTETGALAFALQHPLVVARLFLGILGSIAEFPSYRLGWISAFTTVATGALLLAYAGFVAQRALRDHREPHDPVEFATLVLLLYGLMLIGLIALNRAQVYESLILTASLDGRYRIYGLLIAALCLIDLVRRLDAKGLLSARLMTTVLAVAVIFNVGWYAYRFDTISTAAMARTHALQVWLNTGDDSELPSWALPADEAGRILRQAIEAGVYRP